MKNLLRFSLLLVVWLPCAQLASTQTLSPGLPTWWAKYQSLLKNGAESGRTATSSSSVHTDVDVSIECGPQSETFITLNHSNMKVLTAGSNEIFRLPMRGYFSFDGGSSWGGVDLPLPPPLSGTHDTRFGSDPTLVFYTPTNVFYGYIVVFFGGGSGINWTELAVARLTHVAPSYPPH